MQCVPEHWQEVRQNKQGDASVRTILKFTGPIPSLTGPFQQTLSMANARHFRETSTGLLGLSATQLYRSARGLYGASGHWYTLGAMIHARKPAGDLHGLSRREAHELTQGDWRTVGALRIAPSHADTVIPMFETLAERAEAEIDREFMRTIEVALYLVMRKAAEWRSLVNLTDLGWMPRYRPIGEEDRLEPEAIAPVFERCLVAPLLALGLLEERLGPAGAREFRKTGLADRVIRFEWLEDPDASRARPWNEIHPCDWIDRVTWRDIRER